MGALRGRDWYMARVKKFLVDFPTVVDAAIGQEALVIEAVSKDQCPVDTSRLMNSCNTTSVGTFENPRWRIAYGVDYAMYVHERVDLIHLNGKAKFLEDPLNYLKPNYAQNLWRRTSASLRKAGQ